MSFVIATDKRFKPDVTLFLVDRSKCRISFWSDRLDQAMSFFSLDSARKVCSKYKFNNPRVLDSKQAFEAENENKALGHGDSDDDDGSWDAHK